MVSNHTQSAVYALRHDTTVNYVRQAFFQMTYYRGVQSRALASCKMVGNTRAAEHDVPTASGTDQ